MEKEKTKSLLIVLFGVLLLLPVFARAASLYFSPSSGSYNIGQTFPVNIYVSTGDQAMNAASGIISFPSDKLEVISLVKNGSIFSLWVQEPSFSNSAGTVNFEGIVLNPGFTGSSGKAITINFKAKAVGSAPVSFSSASVLANDGNGTNILSNMGSASFSINPALSAPPKTTAPTEIVGVPEAPKISSLTHPDPDKWYSLSDAKFSWDLSPDITGVRLLLGKNPSDIPTVTYVPPISSKEVNNIEDGIWYFGVRLRNSAGWGEISRFRVQIDTEKPLFFDIAELERKDLTEPKAEFIFDADDKTSGIDYYSVQIDGKSSQIWKDDGSHKYQTPILEPGKYTLVAKAVDKAGNFLVNSAEFEIKALEPPVITEYPNQLSSGESLIIKGITKYPNAQTTVWFEREGEKVKKQTATNGTGGDFVLAVEEKLESGTYKVWAEVVDERGAKSAPSEKVTISIKRPLLLGIDFESNIFIVVIIVLAIISLAALFIVIIYSLWRWWRMFIAIRNKIKRKIRKNEYALHRAFYLLDEEEERIKQLRKSLEDIEKLLTEEIEDIEKNIE